MLHPQRFNLCAQPSNEGSVPKQASYHGLGIDVMRVQLLPGSHTTQPQWEWSRSGEQGDCDRLPALSCLHRTAWKDYYGINKLYENGEEAGRGPNLKLWATNGSKLYTEAQHLQCLHLTLLLVVHNAMYIHNVMQFSFACLTSCLFLLSNTPELEEEVDYWVWYLEYSVPDSVKHTGCKSSGEFPVVLF